MTDSFDGESLYEKEATLLAKKFKKIMKFRKSETRKKPFRGAYDLFKGESSQCTQNNEDTKDRIEKKTQAIQCHECLGYGHMRIRL